MFDKRLLALVPQARAFIALDVVLQWAALVANVALFFLIGTFLQDVYLGNATAQGTANLLAAAAFAVVVRMTCQTLAQIAGQKSAAAAKRAVRTRVYDKLVRLGPAYRESVATAEATQVCVEGTEQLESYFGQYLPQLFYAVLAPLTLFAALAPVSLPAALALLVCVPFIPVSIMAVQKIAKRTMRKYWGVLHRFGRDVPREHPGAHHVENLPSRRGAPRRHERRGGRFPPRHHEPAQDAAELDHRHGPVRIRRHGRRHRRGAVPAGGRRRLVCGRVHRGVSVRRVLHSAAHARVVFPYGHERHGGG